MLGSGEVLGRAGRTLLGERLSLLLVLLLPAQMLEYPHQVICLSKFRFQLIDPLANDGDVARREGRARAKPLERQRHSNFNTARVTGVPAFTSTRTLLP